MTDAHSQDKSRQQQGHNPLRHIAVPDLQKLPDIMKATRIMAFFVSSYPEALSALY